ncbi:Glutathione peroxidase [Trichinella britovi]|uniref:Glutathione peroxidase n=1 Tax=Trichinella britovi TaxID=45882 RepID=A0A0V1DIX2_TRIBR|nr:Glutathione peroxidase [Trichinella britovi]KRZ98081.1 Glutathione peroxidase [Trichinella sp. T8]
MIRHYSRAVLHPRISLFLTSCTALASMSSTKETTAFYEFEANDIDGNLTSMSKYKGNVVIVVNKYNGDGLRIAAFPCNQFGGQEPKSESEIKKFVTERYGVTFDMYSKINVNGKDTHPLWVYLKSKQGGTFGSFIKWNFTKFLVDRTGNPVKRFGPKEDPDSMEKDIVALLNQSKEL